MRYERKYPVTGCSPEAVESFLRLHPLSFSEIFQVRRVNSLYFDTPDWDLLEESLSGDAERMKIRIRWYGDFLNVKNPVLEIKIRHFDTGEKLLFKIPHPNITPIDIAEMGPGLIRDLYAPDMEIRPAVFVSYTRSYFGNPDKRFRVTIDRELAYRNPQPSHFENLAPVMDNSVIAELKYETQDDDWLSEFTEHFPFKIGKSSKFVKGMMLTVAN